MRCRICGAETRVAKTIPDEAGQKVTRRHRCTADPSHRFSTEETEPLLLDQIGIRQTGSGLVVGAFDRPRLIEDLTKSLFYSQSKDQQRSKLNSIASAVADALVRGEAELEPADDRTRERHPQLRMVVEDRTIAGLVDRELSTDPFRVQRVLYAVAIRGRNDRPNRQGWSTAQEALEWILQEFPGIDAKVPSRQLYRREDVFNVSENGWEPRKVVKRGDRGVVDFVFDQFLASVTKSLYGRENAYERALGVARFSLNELHGQRVVLAGQLAHAALSCLRKVDDLAYLRAAVDVKNLASVTRIADEAVDLLASPSSQLRFRLGSGLVV